MTLSNDEIKELVEQYGGTGIIRRNKRGIWENNELIVNNSKIVGFAVNDITGKAVPTDVFEIRYHADRGYHIFPTYPSKKDWRKKR